MRRTCYAPLNVHIKNIIEIAHLALHVQNVKHLSSASSTMNVVVSVGRPLMTSLFLGAAVKSNLSKEFEEKDGRVMRHS